MTQRNFRHYKVVLAVGFSILVGLMAISGFSIVFLSSGMQQRMELIQETYVERVHSVGQIESAVNLLRLLVRDLILTSNNLDRSRIKSRIDSTEELITRRLAQTQLLAAGPPLSAPLQAYRRAVDRYMIAMKEVIDTAMAGNGAVASTLLNTKMLPHRKDLAESSQTLTQSTLQAEELARENIRTLERRFLVMGLLILALAVLLSGLIYLYVSRKFRGYIENLSAAERERENLLELLTDRQKKIEHLMVNLSTVEEEQRKRFARELHDAIGHGLTIAKFHTDSARALLPTDQVHTAEHLDQALGIIKSTLTETKRISYDLRPTLLDDLGFNTAVVQFITEFERRTGSKVHTDMASETSHLDPLREITLYRIVQEAFTNIEKHAQARNVFFQMIRRDNGTIALSISDDGRGFDVKKLAWNIDAHLGLRNILERGELIGGTVLIESHPGKGTEINIELPSSTAERVI